MKKQTNALLKLHSLIGYRNAKLMLTVLEDSFALEAIVPILDRKVTLQPAGCGMVENVDGFSPVLYMIKFILRQGRALNPNQSLHMHAVDGA